MTTEFILLLGLFVFILMGVFLGDNGPRNVFRESAPRLGAQVERQISTGHAFPYPQNAWQIPPGGAPQGTP